MQKVVKFLEGYAQWIALSLGLLWIVWVGYAYWAQKPVAKEIGGQKLGPAEVDEYVTRPGGPIDSLSKSLRPDAKVPQDVKDYFPAVPQYVDMLKAEMSEKNVAFAAVPAMSPPDAGEIKFATDVVVDTKKESTLPILAPGTATILGTSIGMSVAYVPDPMVAVNPKDTTQKLLQPPTPDVVVDPNNPNPPDPAAAPVAPKPIVLVPRELSWVTVSGTLSMKAISDAFTAAKIPDVTAFTQLLRVRLVREEKLADGTWSEHKVINDLPLESKPAWPPKAGGADEGMYLGWSEKNVADIAQPPFYEVVRGQPWRTSSMADPAAGVQPVAEAFDPSKVTDISKLTPDERKKYMEYKAQLYKDEEAKKAEARKSKQPPKPTGPNGSRPATPSSAPPSLAGERIGGPAGRAGVDRSRSTVPPSAPQREFAPTNVPSGLAPAGAGDLPAGTFKPADPAAKDAEVWAHDDTTVPGHVYRYRLEVYLKNPLFATQNVAKNPSDDKVLAIKAETDWSADVTSPLKHYFFAASSGESLGGSTPKMKFEYFWWEQGDWKNKTLNLQPGDAIGTTGWTLVDIRPATANENRALLVNESGAIESHVQKTDINSAKYKELKALLKPSTATATP